MTDLDDPGVLFDVGSLLVDPPVTVHISAGRRRTIRQAQALAHGQHPLALALRWPIRLHPDAAPADDRTAPGLRCGTCWYRTENDRGYPKCAADDGDRITGGEGTDLRLWWPACDRYSPGDPGMSADAARWTP